MGALAFGNPLLPRRECGLQPRSPATSVRTEHRLQPAQAFAPIWLVRMRAPHSPVQVRGNRHLVMPRDLDASPVPMAQPASWVAPQDSMPGAAGSRLPQ